jgi:hypothetical protein
MLMAADLDVMMTDLMLTLKMKADKKMTLDGVEDIDVVEDVR